MTPHRGLMSGATSIAIGSFVMMVVFAVFEISVFRSQPLSLALTFCLVAAAVIIEIVVTRSSPSGRSA